MSNNNSTPLPKPTLKSCDETSLSLTWENISTADKLNQLYVQYKIPQRPWEEANELLVPLDSTEIKNIQDLIDLEPGTPYFVRLLLKNNGSIVSIGPEAVFDTMPIGCTPKKKKCIIM